MRVLTWTPLSFPIGPVRAPISSDVPSSTSDITWMPRWWSGMPWRAIIISAWAERIWFSLEAFSRFSTRISAAPILFSIRLSPLDQTHFSESLAANVCQPQIQELYFKKPKYLYDYLCHKDTVKNNELTMINIIIVNKLTHQPAWQHV